MRLHNMVLQWTRIQHSSHRMMAGMQKNLMLAITMVGTTPNFCSGSTIFMQIKRKIQLSERNSLF